MKCPLFSYFTGRPYMSRGYRPKFEEPKGEEKVDQSDEDEYEEDHEISESEDTSTGAGMSSECEGGAEEAVLFDLYAVSNHSGTLHGGKLYTLEAYPDEYRQVSLTVIVSVAPNSNSAISKS